jgi:uncharacterized protein YcbK (DUF882 family)
MQLSKNFSLAEATVSDTAARNGVLNEPNYDQLQNMIKAAAKLQQLRDHLKRPIRVTSWLRTEALNKLIKGSSKTSAHMTGWAIDCHTDDMSPYDLCKASEKFLTESGIGFDQIIHEYGSWMHISFHPDNRKQTLTIFSNTKGYKYKSGILTRDEYLK